MCPLNGFVVETDRSPGLQPKDTHMPLQAQVILSTRLTIETASDREVVHCEALQVFDDGEVVATLSSRELARLSRLVEPGLTRQISQMRTELVEVKTQLEYQQVYRSQRPHLDEPTNLEESLSKSCWSNCTCHTLDHPGDNVLRETDGHHGNCAAATNAPCPNGCSRARPYFTICYERT